MFIHPVRKIRQSNRSITGKRSSLKNNAIQYFESTLERDYLTLLEHDAEVTSYICQPVIIYYRDNEITRRYTPDVAVYFQEELKRKPLLVELKYAAELDEKKSELQPKFDAASSYSGHNGYEFQIISENDVRKDKLYNIKFLSAYKGGKPDPIIATVLLLKIAEGRATAAELSNGNAESLYTLWQLLSQSSLQCDMDIKITMQTLIWKRS